MNSTSDNVKYFCLIRLDENQVVKSIAFEQNLDFNENSDLPAGLTVDNTDLLFDIFLQTEQGEPLPMKLNFLAQKQKDESFSIFLESVACIALTILRALYREQVH